MKRALVALACCAPIEAHPAYPAPAARAVTTWTRDGLHVSGAPELDRSLIKDIEAFDDALGYRLLDFDLRRGLLAEHGGELEHVPGPGRPPLAQTPYDFNVDWAAFEDDQNIVFTADRDGDEQLKFWVRGLGFRQKPQPAEKFNDHPHVFDPIMGALGVLWWTERDDQGKSTLWSPIGHTDVGGPGEHWTVLAFSRDAGHALVRRSVSLHESSLYSLAMGDGVATAITPEGPNQIAVAGAFGAGDDVYVACTCGGDRVRLYELADKGRVALASDLAWDVTQVAASQDGGHVAFATDEDGVSVLHLYDPKTRTHRLAPNAPTGGVIEDLRFDRASDMLAFSFTDARHPRDVYSYDPATGKLEPWTHALAKPAAVAPTHETIASFDKTPIHALVYRPAHPIGVVVELHGGPEDHFTPTWSPFEQTLVARGYAVVQPNVRGSVGYGAKFAALDDGLRRQDAVRDVGAVLDWIARDKALAGHPVSVLGTSYGGYLALAALSTYPARLKAGIVMSGITDFPTFLAHTAKYRADERRAEYGDERVKATRDFLARISPIASAKAIRAPLLVVHGRRDPRVPADDIDRYVAAVRAAGGTVWYASADDEGHLFSKINNREVVQALVLQLLASTDPHR
jgi:dipeptidyl aminopeptidase/acylaminoacyl peptidase